MIDFFIEKWALLFYFVFSIVLIYYALEFLSLFNLTVFNSFFLLSKRCLNLSEIIFVFKLISSLRIKNYKLILESKDLFLFFLRKYYYSDFDKTYKNFFCIFNIAEKINLFSEQVFHINSTKDIAKDQNMRLLIDKEIIDVKLEKNLKKDFWIKFKGKDFLKNLLVKNQKIKIEYYYISTIFNFKTKIKKVIDSEGYTLLEVKHSKKVKISERRKSFRRDVDIDGFINEVYPINEDYIKKILFLKRKIKKTIFKLKESSITECKLANLSKEGALIFIKNQEEFLFNKYLNLRFIYNNNEFNIICKVLDLIHEENNLYIRVSFVELERIKKEIALREIIYF